MQKFKAPQGYKMFDEPIQIIRQTKEFFRVMGCYDYHMWREFPQRYDEYKQLNISKQTESEGKKNNLMYDLFESLKTDTALIKNAGRYTIYSR